jgi:anti-sigma regulatory factor (Ser/Thr protein kinase)
MFSTAKNNKSFSLVIPAQEKYIPLVRKYVIEVLAAYNFGGGFLYQMEIVIDELCSKISHKVKKQPPLVWLDIRFEIEKDVFLFNILEQKPKDMTSAEKEIGVLDENGIDSPEFGLIERYSDNACLELRNGRISKVKMTRNERAK